jgi:glycosyltransferase involved in cell wall biosynthesis
MSKLLFVVHRYAPYPGGSEYNVQRLAEEALRRGHEVTVLADTHLGDYRGVHVTSDRRAMLAPFDLIVVHGDLSPQKEVLAKAHRLPSPVLYLVVEPRATEPVCQGMQHADFLGWGTSFDLEHFRRFGHESKARRCRYGVPASARGRPGFKAALGIGTSRMYLSAGGFWPRKGMEELRQAFLESRPPDTTLVLMGYDVRRGVPDGGPGVLVVVPAEQQEVLDAMCEADLYVMNSRNEGFGLVLLEAMLNRTPWAARDIAGAHDLRDYGTVYASYEELVCLLAHFAPDPVQVASAQERVLAQHLVEHAFDDIESLLR